MRFRRGCQVAEELGETCVDATQNSGRVLRCCWCPRACIRWTEKSDGDAPVEKTVSAALLGVRNFSDRPPSRRVRRRTSLAGAPRRMRGWQR